MSTSMPMLWFIDSFFSYKDIPPVNEVRFYGFATKPSFVFLNQKPIKPEYGIL